MSFHDAAAHRKAQSFSSETAPAVAGLLPGVPTEQQRQGLGGYAPALVGDAHRYVLVFPPRAHHDDGSPPGVLRGVGQEVV